MDWIYFWILAAILGATLAGTLFKPERIYEYPYFMAGAFTVFIVPQAVSLIRFPGDADPQWIGNVLLMTCLCFAACWAGYQMPPVRSLQQFEPQPVNLDRLFHGGVLFVAINFFFSFLISRMTEEETGGSSWTGRVTIYDFFAQLIYPGFAICLMTALRTGGLVAWLATVVAAIHPIQSSVLAGRRETTVMFLMTVALTLYYRRGIKPPRAAIILSVIGAMVAIPATGTYRGLAVDRDWRAVGQYRFVNNFKEYLNSASVLELRNAAALIEAARRSGSYQYGEGYWDQLVFRFVPAQWLGKEFKDSLMFHASAELAESELTKLYYDVPPGSTFTGMGDSFQQLGWLGCLFFAAMGAVYKTVFRASRQRNSIFAQLFYIQTATTAMRAVTNQTLDFLPGLVYCGIFLGLLFLYARDPARPIHRGRRNQNTRDVQCRSDRWAAAPASTGARSCSAE